MFVYSDKPGVGTENADGLVRVNKYVDWHVTLDAVVRTLLPIQRVEIEYMQNNYSRSRMGS